MFSPLDRCTAILASLFISFQIKNCTLLCWLADDCNPQLKEIVSNFEIISKQIFNVAADECSSLIDVVWLLNICSLDVYQM